MRKELRFSGSGGQGVITAAIIFAEAAVAEGKEAVQSQSYGPEARGGASKAEVIFFASAATTLSANGQIVMRRTRPTLMPFSRAVRTAS